MDANSPMNKDGARCWRLHSFHCSIRNFLQAALQTALLTFCNACKTLTYFPAWISTYKDLSSQSALYYHYCNYWKLTTLLLYCFQVFINFDQLHFSTWHIHHTGCSDTFQCMLNAGRYTLYINQQQTDELCKQ